MNVNTAEVVVSTVMKLESYAAVSPFISVLIYITISVLTTSGHKCNETDVRLIGKALHDGQVRICLSGEWGLVCDQGNYANVVCRQLGYDGREFVFQIYFNLVVNILFASILFKALIRFFKSVITEEYFLRGK